MVAKVKKMLICDLFWKINGCNSILQTFAEEAVDYLEGRQSDRNSSSFSSLSQGNWHDDCTDRATDTDVKETITKINKNKRQKIVSCFSQKQQYVFILNEGITVCLESIGLYSMCVSTIFYSIVSFTYPVIRLHVSTVCQSS